MCQKPLVINGKFQGDTMTAQCRNCDECLAHRKRHWIGRMLAEEQTCHSVWFMTLTYAGGYENEAAYVIDYTHVQKLFKRIRRAGHRFKYMAVGEHGTAKGRAHFHILMFWQDEPPQPEWDTLWSWDFWPYGHVNVQKPRSNQGCAVYLMDYMNKDNLKMGLMKYSKNPMLGEEYLLEYARDHARHGLPLFAKSDRFSLPDNPSQSGKPFYYPVGRQTGVYKKMLDAFLLEWAVNRPEQRLKLSDDVVEYLEDVCQQTDDYPLPVQQYISVQYGYEPIGDIPEMNVETTYAFERLNLIHRAPLTRIETFNDHGEMIWQSESQNLSNGHVKHLSNAQVLAQLVQVWDQIPPRSQRYLGSVKSLISDADRLSRLNRTSRRREGLSKRLQQLFVPRLNNDLTDNGIVSRPSALAAPP